MKHLILDHMRRWGWVLALAGLFEAFVGWGVQRHPDGNFEFWCLLTSLWAGANLLQQDFPRGIVRAVSIMPVTSRQVGQGWWLATVLIPAVILTALLGLGAGIYQFIHPGHALQFDRLELAAAFTSIWLGIVGCGVFSTLSFRVSSGIATAGGLAGPWWNLKSTGLVGLLSTVFILGGMVYFQDASKVPFKMVLFLGLGMVLTLLGWFRAATFDFAPVVMKGVAPLQRPGGFPALHRAPSGFGGLPFLLATTFLKTFLVSLLMARIMYIMMTLQGHVKDIGTFMVPMAMFVPMWLILVLLMPFLSQIRYLRDSDVCGGGPGRFFRDGHRYLPGRQPGSLRAGGLHRSLVRGREIGLDNRLLPDDGNPDRVPGCVAWKNSADDRSSDRAGGHCRGLSFCVLVADE